MIISHKHKLIYIKSLKTAGTSVEIFLSPHCGDKDIVTAISPGHRQHKARNHGASYYNHMKPNKIKNKIGKNIFNSYFKFANIRNPWDLVVSRFFRSMAIRVNENNINITKTNFNSYLSNNKLLNNVNFRQFCFLNDSFVLDDVIRYENLHLDLKRICSRFNIDFDINKLPNAKGNFRKFKNIPYWEFYNDKSIKIVPRIYSKKRLNILIMSLENEK